MKLIYIYKWQSYSASRPVVVHVTFGGGGWMVGGARVIVGVPDGELHMRLGRGVPDSFPLVVDSRWRGSSRWIRDRSLLDWRLEISVGPLPQHIFNHTFRSWNIVTYFDTLTQTCTYTPSLAHAFTPTYPCT